MLTKPQPLIDRKQHAAFVKAVLAGVAAEQPAIPRAEVRRRISLVVGGFALRELAENPSGPFSVAFKDLLEAGATGDRL